MSLSGILNIANSGLQTAQTGLRTVSDNVSNVDTTGYIRKVADQNSVAVAGQGSGVDVTQIQLAADRFLQAAGLEATADSGAAAAKSSSLDQAQALFGNPNDATSFFSQLNGVFSSFGALSSDSSSASRSTAVSSVQDFLDSAGQISTSLSTLQSQADAKAQDDVTTINGLLKQIDALNSDISKATVTGRDATGSQNQQSTLIDQLSSLMDVHVSQSSGGGVVVRASDGLALAGDSGPATLSYSNAGGTGQVSVTLANGSTSSMGGRLQSGELKGLLDLRNTDLPNMSAQLGEMVSQTVATLNAAHNANSAVPAPQTLTGRATALSSTEAFSGVSGKTTVSVTDASGKVQRQVAIDFDAGTMSVDGGAATAFTPATFAGSLNTALGTFGTASFSSGGQLQISASSASNGVAVADDPTAPTSKAGSGFSDFFGLNDLITSAVPADYDTGLTNASAAGFTGQITLRLTAADGSAIKDLSIDTSGAATMSDLVSKLNSATGGVGLYGAFKLDDATGALSFTPAANSGVALSVVSDTSARGAGGPSLSAMFGIGDAVRGTRTANFSVRADIAADPGKLALAKVDTTATTGGTALYSGDASGADALAQAGRATATFDPAGGLAGGKQTISDYASGLSSAIANAASSAEDAQTNASAVATEATSRRSSVEGVNLDQELISMTTYQQAYNASARMIQTVNDLYTSLLGMLN